MGALIRCLIAILIAAASVALVISIMPRYSVEPCGIVLPSNGAQPAVSGPIKLYDRRAAPLDAKTIGTVTMMYHTDSQDQPAQELLFAALSQKVTQQGGDGVMVEQFFFIPAATASGPGLYFKGKVLRLPSSTNS